LFATGVAGDKFDSGVVDTGGKLPRASGVVTGGKFPPVLLTPVANLPQISTTPAKLIAKFAAGVVDMVVHLDLRISP
jgi:hypothetical protein